MVLSRRNKLKDCYINMQDEEPDWYTKYGEDLEKLGIKSMFLYKKINFFETCYYKNLTLKLGDCVLISSEDSLDPEDVETADVGKILYLYKNNELDYKDDRNRAIIQWYNRSGQILADNTVVSNDEDKTKEQILMKHDVVEDNRYGRDISVETIFDHCHLEIREVFDTILPQINDDMPVFICRYRLQKQKSKKYSFELEPVIGAVTVKTPLKTPKKTPKKVQRPETETVWLVDLSPVKEEAEEQGIKLKLKKAATPLKNTRRNSILKTPNSKRDESTPSKRVSIVLERLDAEETSKTRRNSILKTPNSTKKDESTPRKRVSICPKMDTIEDEENTSPPKRRKNDLGTPKSRARQTPEKTPRARSLLHQFIGQRATPVKSDGKQMQIARERLHVSAVPEALPCRENEFREIYNFLADKLQDNCGGCMYVSGVPGTGKTATTSQVIRSLQKAIDTDEIPDFDFIDINGMRLTEPRQAYVHIYRQVSGKTVSWEHAYQLLDKRFNTPSGRRKMTILMVDELDILCNKRQDVVYNLLNWPTLNSAGLVVLTIANTMDLPERLLMGKIASRLGLTRLTFQPYTFQQLQQIIEARICGTDTFNKDAIQLVARKVAAVSGDARRALDICRRATEIAESEGEKKTELFVVSIPNVQKALAEMIASPKIQFIKSCTKYEKMWLQAVCAEVSRTGVEEVIFDKVYTQLETIAAFNGAFVPPVSHAIGICTRLGASRLLICEHGRKELHMKILLNVSSDDVHFALNSS